MIHRLRVVVVNPNSTLDLTDHYVAQVRLSLSALGVSADVDGLTGTGPASIESSSEGIMGAASVLPALAEGAESYDFGVFAAYGDPGREAAQEVACFPVLGITEASAMVAQTLGDQFGVITTVVRAVRQIEELLARTSLDGRCAGVVATGLGVLAIDQSEETLEPITRAGRTLLGRGRCEVLCLGCAAMTGLEARLSGALGVPVVDGLKAAVGLGLTIVASGLSVNQAGWFAPPARLRAEPTVVTLEGAEMVVGAMSLAAPPR